MVAEEAEVPAKPGAKPAVQPAPALVTYVVLRPGLENVQFIAPPSLVDADAATALTKLPKKTAAVFVPQAKGSTALLAVARVQGKSVVARFDVVVGGELPKGGCAK